MQIPTLVQRYLYACDLSFTFCAFDTVAFLIVITVVTHGNQLGELAVMHGHVTRSSFDIDECHVTAFRPVSEVTHSWSYDNMH